MDLGAGQQLEDGILDVGFSGVSGLLRVSHEQNSRGHGAVKDCA